MHTNPFAEPGSGDVGGMNVVVRHAAEVLERRGWNVEVFSRRADESSPAVEVHEGVRLHRLSAGPARVATKREQEEYVPEFTDELRRLHREATRHGRPWTIIHSHHWFSGAAAVELAAELGLPHVQSYHSIAARRAGDWDLGEQPEGPERVPAEARLATQSDAIIAVSRAEGRTAIELGAPPGRVHVATPGVDHGVFHPGGDVHDPFHLSERPTVIAAARLEPLKGLDLAIETLARLPASHRPRLVITGAPTGGYEGYDHELHSLVQEHGLTKDVWFAGPLNREDLARAMRKAQVVLVPSHSETYGLVALEAAACGTPVLAANVGGLPDAVINGETGVVVEGRDPGEWAKHLQWLLTSPATLQRMSIAAVEHAAGFTWEKMVDRWEETYNALM